MKAKEEEVYRLIGSRIKRRREELNMTQFELNKKAKLSKKYVSRVESGKAKIKVYTLYKIADVLQISIIDLMYGVEVNSKTNLDKKFNELFAKCSYQKLELIYKLAKLVYKAKFI